MGGAKDEKGDRNVRKVKIIIPVIGIVVGLLALWFLMTFFPGNGGSGDDRVGAPPLGPVDETQLSALARRGADVFRLRGCTACHTTDGTESIGPTLRGAWGTERELEDGSVVVMDEAYVRESIVDPNAKLVKGYLPVMSSYAWLADEEIDALVAFIREIGN